MQKLDLQQYRYSWQVMRVRCGIVAHDITAVRYPTSALTGDIDEIVSTARFSSQYYSHAVSPPAQIRTRQTGRQQALPERPPSTLLKEENTPRITLE